MVVETSPGEVIVARGSQRLRRSSAAVKLLPQSGERLSLDDSVCAPSLAAPPVTSESAQLEQPSPPSPSFSLCAPPVAPSSPAVVAPSAIQLSSPASASSPSFAQVTRSGRVVKPVISMDM